MGYLRLPEERLSWKAARHSMALAAAWSFFEGNTLCCLSFAPFDHRRVLRRAPLEHRGSVYMEVRCTCGNVSDDGR